MAVLLLKGKSKAMKISVIVPVYNTGKYLVKCVESLCGQTYKNLQIILVNDGSVDDSLSIMCELADKDERICIIDKVHEGVSAARNAGLEKAIGHCVSFIDSDDWLKEEMYEKMISVMKACNAEAVFTGWVEEYSDGSNKVVKNKVDKGTFWKGEQVLAYYFNEDMRHRLTCVLFKAEALQGVRFDTALERGEDMLFTFHALCNTKSLVYIDEALYYRYNRLGSLSNRKGFYLEDFGRATCTDCMLKYVKEHKLDFVQSAYVKCFNYYMIILNRLVYFRAEKEYEDVYRKVIDRLKELMQGMECPRKTLPKRLYICYRIYRILPFLYYFIVKVYYRYVKKELDGKRQR